jgi:hypothetical protein
MTTRAGKVLDVEIDDTTVTINGNVTIVLGDIFCEQGILHLIDNLLTFLSWDVFLVLLGSLCRGWPRAVVSWRGEGSSRGSLFSF